jgi:hypothetical protein
MVDVLKVHGSTGGAMLPVMIGIASVTDNHGNSLKGFQLTCAGKQPVSLGTLEWLALNDGTQLPGSIFSEIKLYPWQTSALQKNCVDFNATGRTTAAHR